MTLKSEPQMAPTRNVFSPLKPREDDRDAAYADFPKVFEKSFWENLDKRFTFILVATLLINALLIAYFVSHPPPRMSNQELARIQKQFARLVLEKTPAAEPETKFVEKAPLLPLTPAPAPAEEFGPSEATHRENRSSRASLRAQGAAEPRAEMQHLAGALGRRTREQITREVSRTGILGLLTSENDLENNEAAIEVLKGGNAPIADLNEALANVGQVKRAAYDETGGEGTDGGGREVRGSRATNAGGIDALVQGLGEGKAKNVQRTGNFEVGHEEPLIETEDVKISGTRDQDAIAEIVARHTSAIQSCYQRALKRMPNLRGKLVVRFVINPQGTVESVTIVSSTLNNAEVENCVVQRIKRWDNFGAIDPSKGNTTIRQVYTFGY